MSQRGIFLSHAHQDDDAVLKLDATLRERGIEVDDALELAEQTEV